MPESTEALWLRTHWNEESLGRYRNRWIAVLGEEVVSSDEDLDALMNRFLEYRQKPLFAFVFFGRLQ